MFGYGFLRTRPTDLVVLYTNGVEKKKGHGIGGLVFLPITTAEAVPTDTRDEIFAVEAMTQDFQTVTVQGLLSWRITDAEAARKRQDFSIDLRGGAFLGDPLKRIVERLVAIVQTAVRDAIVRITLEQALTKSSDLAREINAAMAADTALSADGIGVDRVLVTSVKAAPEIRKALEAELREMLLRKADFALFERRQAASSDEHGLKMMEIDQLRESREAELRIELALEQERQALVEMQARNHGIEGQGDGAYWREAMGPLAQFGPQMVLALALRDFARQENRLSSLSVGGDTLTALLRAFNEAAPGPSGQG